MEYLVFDALANAQTSAAEMANFKNLSLNFPQYHVTENPATAETPKEFIYNGETEYFIELATGYDASSCNPKRRAYDDYKAAYDEQFKYRIYDMIPDELKSQPVTAIDFKTDLLPEFSKIKVVTKQQGQPVESIYYKEVDENGVPIIPYARVDWTFNRNPITQVVENYHMNLKWYKNNGDIGTDTKDIAQQYLSPEWKIDELEQRRTSLVKNMMYVVYSSIPYVTPMNEGETLQEFTVRCQLMALDLQKSNTGAIRDYIDSGDPLIIKNIYEADPVTYPWLDANTHKDATNADVTLREYIMLEVDIPGTQIAEVNTVYSLDPAIDVSGITLPLTANFV
jgi:hypothetical protein